MNCCDDYRDQLDKAQQEELCDAGFYARMAEEAPNGEQQNLIAGIAGDEYNHARMLAALLGCCPPCPGCPPECCKATGDFCRDVKLAIQKELEAIKRYSQLARCAPTQKIRALLTSILGDEYAHLRLWNAMLQARAICSPEPCMESTCQEKSCCQE